MGLGCRLASLAQPLNLVEGTQFSNFEANIGVAQAVYIQEYNMSSKEPVPNVKRKISIKEHGFISFKFGGGIFLLAIFIGYVFLKLVPDGNVKVRTLGICIIFLCWLWSSYWLNWLFPEKFNYEIDHDINKFSQIVRRF